MTRQELIEDVRRPAGGPGDQPPPRFGLSTLLLAMGLAAVGLGLWRWSPWATLGFAAYVWIAVLATAARLTGRRARGERVSSGRRVGTFLMMCAYVGGFCATWVAVSAGVGLSAERFFDLVQPEDRPLKSLVHVFVVGLGVAGGFAAGGLVVSLLDRAFARWKL